MSDNEIIVPIIHVNGTSAEELIWQRKNVLRAFFNLEQALSAAGPHRRDFYPVDGLYEQAIEQHRLRVEALFDVRRGFENELTALMERAGL